MTAHAVQFIWWIVGTLGIAGLVAFWFLLPTAAQLTLQAVVKAFNLVLSYRLGCALLAGLAVGLIVDNKRHAYDDAQFAKQTAVFEAAQNQRDVGIAQKTRETVWLDIANATAENSSIDKEVRDFTNGFPAIIPTPTARPVGNPFLVGADAGRLCHLAGQTECGSASGQGVPKARRPSSGSGDHAKIRLPSLIRTGARSDQQGK